MTPGLKNALQDQAVSIAVWGGGFVGYSTAATFARAGLKVYLVDINPYVVEAVNAGKCPVHGLRDWLAFDPATVADRATFDDPHQYPDGIPHVVVNGVLTLREAEHTGDLGGRGVKGEATTR